MNKYQSIALVIANSSYEFNEELECCLKDANDIAKKFEELSIHVIRAIDEPRKTLLDRIDDFLVEAESYEVAIVYYTGHGVQIDGKNYIIPIDSAPSNSKAVFVSGLIDINALLNELEIKENRVNIIILDACRSEQRFAKGWSFLPGLAEMTAGSGSFVSFATAPGTRAIGGKDIDSNSLFTKHLLEYIAVPNLPIETVFKKVRQAVEIESNGDQVPWESTSLKDEFCFNTVTEQEMNERIYHALRGNQSASILIRLSSEFNLTISDVLRRYDYIHGNRPGGIIIRDRDDREMYLLKRMLEMGFRIHNYRWVYNDTPVRMGDFLFDPRKADHSPQTGREIEVFIDVRIEIIQDGVLIVGNTSLPEGMKILVTLSGNKYMAQSHTQITRGGSFISEKLSYYGTNLKPGTYLVEISSPLVSIQPANVQTLLGIKGQNMIGESVRDDLIDGKTLSFYKEITIV